MNHYEAKQEARRERLEARAAKLRAEGERRVARSHEMAEGIPFGQPILVGHHSEKRDRNYRGKIESGFRKGYGQMQAAGEIAARAASVGSGGISSDDPDAVAKLRDELAKFEAKAERYKAINATIRKNKADPVAALVAAGYSEKLADELVKPDFAGRVGIPAYSLTNLGANIRRIKARIALLEAASAAESKSKKIGEIEIVEDVEANRLRMIFPGKPSADVIGRLKSAGFRWAPSEGAWQRHLSNSARWWADQIAEAA